MTALTFLYRLLHRLIHAGDIYSVKIESQFLRRPGKGEVESNEKS